jgi:tetratricopeptide (TPR) repeat protein
MKLSHARFALLILVLLVSTPGCGVVNRIRAKNEINEAARAYKSGRFAEAQQHSERALQLYPDDQNAPVFIARSIHAQYKQGVDTPENLKKADQAIAAYKRILEKNPNNDEAYKAVAFLLGQLNRTDEQIAWIKQRATDESVDPAKRSESYTFLANKEWECSFQVTELKTNQKMVEKEGKTIVQWVKPQDQAEYDKINMCVTRGLENVETAIKLDPNNEKAWGYKTNLLLEKVKIADMDNKPEDKASYKKQADEAQARTTQLSDQKKKEEEAKKAPSPPAT